MGKYLLKRILFSIFSLLVVVMVVMLLVYTLIPRSAIFQTDDTWNKKSGNDRTYYEFVQYQKYGYLEYASYSNFLSAKYKELYGEKYDSNSDYIADKNAIKYKDTYLDNDSVQEFIKLYEKKGYEITYLSPETYKNGRPKAGSTAYLLASKESNPVLRLWNYVKNFISFETIHDVDDPNLTEENRYVRLEKDPYGLFAVVGSGTTHKYLLYFDGRFPFIHQNWMHINLGVSFTRFRGEEITTVINRQQGDMKTTRQQYPNMVGTDEYVDTAINFHSLTYNPKPTEIEKTEFPDNYTSYQYSYVGLSMIENSFVIGLIATALSYLLGIPLGMSVEDVKKTIARIKTIQRENEMKA